MAPGIDPPQATNALQPIPTNPFEALTERESITTLDTLESTPQQTNPSRSRCKTPPLTPQLEDEPTQGIQLQDTWTHSGWKKRRESVFEALQKADISLSRVARFASCGSSYWVLRNRRNPNLFRTVPDTCHDRFCVPCARARASRIVANLAAKAPAGTKRLITLTLARDDLGLRDRTTRLLKAFTALRRSKLWKETVTGGVGFLEVSRGARGDHWHPHLHVIAQGRYIPATELRDEWLRITRDSHVVDIRLVKDEQIVVRYVLKYCTKPVDSDLFREPAALREAIDALRGRKLLYAFGSWAKLRLLAVPKTDEWELFGHMAEVVFRSITGDSLCADLLAVINARGEDEIGAAFEIAAPADGPAP